MFPTSQTKTLAILVRATEGSPPFTDELFCRRLSLGSMKYALQIIVIPISNDAVHLPLQWGYVYHQGKWNSVPVPAVDLIMDRCLRPISRYVRQQLKEWIPTNGTDQHRYWSASLPGKWEVHRVLSRNPELRSQLAPTTRIGSRIPWETWLDRWPKGLFFKPVSGTHGKNTFRLSRGTTPSTWIVEGRNEDNEPFFLTFNHTQAVSSWLALHQAERKMIVQPYLELSHHGRAFDIRALMQKNGQGRWTLTGCMVREGPEGSLTSNLHGGGKAYPAHAYLLQRYGTIRTETLLKSIRQTATLIPTLLESRFGRLAELGLDFGADAEGQLWLIEVNSKPGRTSFAEAGDRRMHTLTYTRPLAYARYLLQQHVLTDVFRPMKLPNTSSKAGLKPIPIHGG
ncbi:endospore coat-associated protein [Paenibacillus sp. BGI2013]|uniref:YheC/YheD family endospore coat-associated protein n=1 Tax=Paenibacillus sp. BGI2013 TaxID=2058902 RepID=UPI000C6CC0CA|nr:YheC/YheD family protein [Paenibacillus sp. BGI2013]PKQ92774.1 endospore coat-associated protein [Paenibacillus sp. BGI2013]